MWRRPNVWPSIPWGRSTSQLVLMIRTSECTIAACWCVAASKCHKKPQTGDLPITSNYTNKTLHDFNEAWILFHLSLRIMYNCTFMQMTSIQIQNYVKDFAAFIMITLLQYIFIHLLYYFLFRCLQNLFPLPWHLQLIVSLGETDSVCLPCCFRSPWSWDRASSAAPVSPDDFPIPHDAVTYFIAGMSIKHLLITRRQIKISSLYNKLINFIIISISHDFECQIPEYCK